MSPSKPDESTPPDRRQSFRCAVKGPRRHGRLRIGKREFPVRILEEHLHQALVLGAQVARVGR